MSVEPMEDNHYETDTYTVDYEIRSLMDNYATVAYSGSVTVEATDEEEAEFMALEQVREDSPYYDPRVDPQVTVQRIR